MLRRLLFRSNIVSRSSHASLSHGLGSPSRATYNNFWTAKHIVQNTKTLFEAL